MLTADNGGTFNVKHSGYQYCANHQFDVCNWLVPVNNDTPFCKACELNHTIPNLSDQVYRQQWALIEAAKHRLVYSLFKLQLPFASKLKQPDKGLCFDFVADENNKPVFTGHDNGVITINIKEADSIEREMAKKNMQENYRTLLGHFRHEVGHYYWDVLISYTNNIASFRQLFGDDNQDYEQALNRHYQNGPPANWADNYISAYASTHPWEDWAETWAHYMHIMDTLETASAYNIRVKPGVGKSRDMQADIDFDPYTEKKFDKILQEWLPLTYAMNSLNRSMGIGDVYPFVIAPAVVQKLAYIHRICYEARDNHKGWGYFS